MDHVATVIQNEPAYVLLDEQLVVYDKVFACARSGFHDKQKTVIVVKGGPGTGKSVIAINLMADLLVRGYNAHYATGSRAFTTTLRTIIGARGSVQFKYFNSYLEAERDEVDVLICDEAHRIRKTSNDRFTPAARRSGTAQIQELLHASKVAVFFIDDKQVVKPDEIGSVDYIKENAVQAGCKIVEYELEAQFRCGGSDAFVNWINNTLQVKRTANVLWDVGDGFDFRIFDTPLALEGAVRDRANEGFSARLTAGFCWKWTKEPLRDGSLAYDVVIGDFSRPWNARPEAKRLAKGIPKATLWAHDPNGINQIGCVYTAQGFEFDYVGVIFGPILFTIPALQCGSVTFTNQQILSFVARGCLSRFGQKHLSRATVTRYEGCYVHFMDENSRNFFVSRMERSTP